MKTARGTGHDACGEVVLDCGDASCSVSCAADACSGLAVECGAGACSASCEGEPAPEVDCAASCACTAC